MDLIDQYFPNLTPLQCERFAALQGLYAEWNSKINVISRRDMEHFYERHVLHSLAIGRVCPFPAGARVMDVGTGGGFPGIPLAILFPEARFWLVDSIGKKITVVREVAAALGLDNVVALNARAETVWASEAGPAAQRPNNNVILSERQRVEESSVGNPLRSSVILSDSEESKNEHTKELSSRANEVSRGISKPTPQKNVIQSDPRRGEAWNLRARGASEPPQFDWVVSRAVTDMSTFLGWIRGKIAPGGSLFYLKGGDLAAELAAAGRPYTLHNIHDLFPLDFFETKQVVRIDF